MQRATFTYNADPATLKGQISQFFAQMGYTVRPVGDWALDVELGSTVGKMFMGVFTKHIHISVNFNTAPDGSSQLTLQRIGSGVEGGFVGMAQAGSQFGEVAVAVQNRLANAGMLVGEPVFA